MLPLPFILLLLLFWKLYRLGYTLFRSAKDPFLASLGLGLATWMVCALLVNCFGDRWNYMQISGYMWAIAACVVRGHEITDEETTDPQEVRTRSSTAGSVELVSAT